MNIIHRQWTDLPVAIIGAGAAGLSAAHTLHAAEVPFVLLEARARIGGRACTTIHENYPLDLGCGWLHCADINPWAKIAEHLGFPIDKTPPAWERQSGHQGMSAAEQQEFQKAFAAFEKRLKDADVEDDRPAATLTETGNRWNAMLNAISSYLNGAELDRISAKDFQNYKDTDVNWRIERGYGALVAKFGEGIPVALNCIVRAIDHRNRILHLETSLGEIAAGAAIVTIPANLLARGAIRFVPDIPDTMEAASHLPLGIVNKLFLACEDARLFPKDGHFFGNIHDPGTGSHHLRPFGRPMIEVFIAGRRAEDLAKEDSAASIAFAVDELTSLIGSDIRKHVRPLACSRWEHDPFAAGSYSYAHVGHAGARATLQRSIEDRIFFAGEACSKEFFATTHGAYFTGREAAHALIRAHEAQIVR